MVSTIGIVGLGLIGGSLALRLVDAGCDVVAWNHRDHCYAAAREKGIRCVYSLDELVEARPRIVVLCNPLRAMPEVLSRLSRSFDPNATTLTDVGSVKGMVRRQVVAAGLGDCYVGAHPMAGNERSGFAAADASLFDGALWAVTVDAGTSKVRLDAVARMITGLVGDELIVVDDEMHDRAAAMISHMPHAVSTAMINELCDDPERAIAAALSAGSWRDMTRVALTDPARTRSMIEEDSANVERLLRSMASRLESFADALHSGDDGTISEFFRHGQAFRDYRSVLTAGVTSRDSSVVIPGDGSSWREELMTSAKRGERIRGVHSDGSFEAVPKPFA
ncbi:prephenate dehydrogenase/arogenate dehydrogenase family protein [uncultured Bifidobacterium sp.]|uniref:prephenate dehydrogenase n=1 Tax=uncultured Bifidobacterium sp. TaxID=165187 RepID=UPI002634B2F2|nr:prephenate dehydrogenase/arogenate dehydrogenase family protein [uncultured Bifidobacterium sp.]